MNFLIDENATIGSVLSALKTEGVKTADVAKAIKGISEKPLRNALKQAGYDFRNKAPKGWHYIGVGEQPLSKSIFDYVKKSNTHVNKSSHELIEGEIHVNTNSPEVVEGNTPVNMDSHEVIESNKRVNSSNTDITPISPVIHPQFTRDELNDLMTMLHEWRTNKLTTPDSLHERIKQLPKGDKIRKTIVIDKNIGERLDKYCEVEKVNKSDILHLALMDFLDRH